MADIYCDYTNGNDTTGAGTSGNPWKTIQKSVNVAVAGDTIFIANTSAQVLTAAITFNTGFGGGTSVTAPLIIKAWNNGGSIVINNPSGNILAATIDGNSIATTIFGSASKPAWVYIQGIKFTNTTGGLVLGSNGWNFYNCEFYTAGTSYLLNGGNTNGVILNCVFRDSGGTSIEGITTPGAPCMIRGCYFKNLTGYAITTNGNNFIFQNVIETGDEGGILCDSTNSAYIANNTIIGDSTASIKGIDVTTGTRRVTIVNNLIANFSGTSAVAISQTAGSNLYMLGNNAFYNNTSNISGKNVLGVDLTANDVTEPGNPFVDAPNADYTLVSTALSRGASLPLGFSGSDTLNFNDIGGVQSEAQSAGTIATAYMV